MRIRPRQQFGAKTLRTFHEAAGSTAGAGEQRSTRRPPMRLSYYGGGHYDSVSPIPVVGDALGPASAQAAAEGMVLDAGRAGHPPTLEAVEPPPEPGRLEEEALERSRRRAALAGNGRWVGRCGMVWLGGWLIGCILQTDRQSASRHDGKINGAAAARRGINSA